MGTGKVFVVGLGPGEKGQITPNATQALAQSDLLVGYSVYIDLIKADFPRKAMLCTPMTKEVDRCHQALQEAQKGKIVSMVCSGDAGVYGMAGLMLELAAQYEPMEIEVVGGLTAATSGAALLGAPLMHDFAVISLSDLLTPWVLIEKRLRCAAEGDFVICLYNPASKKRKDHLAKACDILLQYRTQSTVTGLVHHVGREGESVEVLSLKELRNATADMFTTVFIGNSQTKNIGGKMVTPRGYSIQ